MIKGVYYFDLGKLMTPETRQKKIQKSIYNKQYREKQKKALFLGANIT
jgi:hypothetical protein